MVREPSFPLLFCLKSGLLLTIVPFIVQLMPVAFGFPQRNTASDPLDTFSEVGNEQKLKNSMCMQCVICMHYSIVYMQVSVLHTIIVNVEHYVHHFSTYMYRAHAPFS